MARISQGWIWDGNSKAGYVEGSSLYSPAGRLIGWFDNGRVYWDDGAPAGYVEGNDIYRSDGRNIGSLKENFQYVARGDAYYSPMLCAAITLLFSKS